MVNKCSNCGIKLGEVSFCCTDMNVRHNEMCLACSKVIMNSEINNIKKFNIDCSDYSKSVMK